MKGTSDEPIASYLDEFLWHRIAGDMHSCFQRALELIWEYYPWVEFILMGGVYLVMNIDYRFGGFTKMENMVDPSDIEQSLMSYERLDRNSPDLWPEQIPGMSEFADLTQPEMSPPKWLAEVDKVDNDMLHEFGSLTTSQLIEKVKGLHQLAFQLGLDEAHEMVRGKFLNILSKPQKR